MTPWVTGTAGALLGLALVAWSRRAASAPSERAVLAWGLVIAAAIYVAFALRSGSLGWLGMESLGLAVFASLAAAGAWRWASLLAVGWAGHVLWDVWLHGSGTPFVPRWYPPCCVGFDLAVAGAIVLRMHAWRTPQAARDS